MSATDPNPNVDPTITGQEAWFNKDVRIYEDLYVYGNLYYNFEGTDSLNLDNLNVVGIATFNDIDINGTIGGTDLDITVRNFLSTGISTFSGDVFIRDDIFFTKQVENLQIGILTATDSFQFINSGNEYLTIKGTGSRAGNVGINSAIPKYQLDVHGDARFTQAITGNLTGNATGLSGTPTIDVANVTAGIVTANNFVGDG